MNGKSVIYYYCMQIKIVPWSCTMNKPKELSLLYWNIIFLIQIIQRYLKPNESDETKQAASNDKLLSNFTSPLKSTFPQINSMLRIVMRPNKYCFLFVLTLFWFSDIILSKSICQAEIAFYNNRNDFYIQEHSASIHNEL